jgi:SAM-dependent methyltransferase
MLEDVAVPDPDFAHPRLAAIDDFMDADRSDLHSYVELANEVGACSLLDIACGTGTFACRLANRGKRVVGLDPALAWSEFGDPLVRAASRSSAAVPYVGRGHLG